MIGAKFRYDSSVFEKKMGNIVYRLLPYLKVRAQDLARTALVTIKRFTPRTRRGRTDIRQLWEIEHTRRGTVESFIIHNTYPKEEVIAYLEHGTPARYIRPRSSKVLAWIDEDTNAQAFARFTRHPGTEPFQMISKTEQLVDRQMNDYIIETLRRVDEMVGR